MYGAIIGDIVGSRFEFDNHRSTDFQMFHRESDISDDTVCTVAVAEWLLAGDKPLTPILQSWCQKYPHESYGGSFRKWITNPIPYDSFGNGSAMRVSPVGLYVGGVSSVMHLARESAIVSHTHLEGIKGAQAVAVAVYLARTMLPKQVIEQEISRLFGYNLTMNLDLVRINNKFDETCQVTVPQAIACFLQSTGYENAIRLAVSIGGDSDTIAAMTGSIAGAFYGIPQWFVEFAKNYIPREMQLIINKFENETTIRTV